MIRCTQNTLDVYINGVITKSIALKHVPKQNYGSVLVALNGGFNGYLADLQYFNTTPSYYDIVSIYKKGPNTKPTSSNSPLNTALATNTTPGIGSAPVIDSNYINAQWYF